MATEKKSGRRISRVMAHISEGREVQIRIICRNEKAAKAVQNGFNSDAGKAQIRKAALEYLDKVQPVRGRAAELQVQVPSDLRKRWSCVVGKLGPRQGNNILRKEIAKYVNLRNGKRRPKKTVTEERKNKYKGIARAKEFKERGRQLVRDAKLVKYTFNAGSIKGKQGLIDWVKSMELNASQFFSALMERICDKKEAEQRPQTNAADDKIASSSEGGVLV